LAKRLGSVRWTWRLEQFSVSYSQVLERGCLERYPRKDIDMALVELTEEQTVTAEITPLTAKGNPAPIHGDVVWTLSDPAAGTLEVDAEDSKKAKFTAIAVEGVVPADITAEFDADMGDGVRTITAVGQVVVKDAEAVTAEVTFGTPE
jgi:hypothetical protein